MKHKCLEAIGFSWYNKNFEENEFRLPYFAIDKNWPSSLADLQLETVACRPDSEFSSLLYRVKLCVLRRKSRAKNPLEKIFREGKQKNVLSGDIFNRTNKVSPHSFSKNLFDQTHNVNKKFNQRLLSK